MALRRISKLPVWTQFNEEVAGKKRSGCNTTAVCKRNHSRYAPAAATGNDAKERPSPAQPSLQVWRSVRVFFISLGCPFSLILRFHATATPQRIAWTTPPATAAQIHQCACAAFWGTFGASLCAHGCLLLGQHWQRDVLWLYSFLVRLQRCRCLRNTHLA